MGGGGNNHIRHRSLKESLRPEEHWVLSAGKQQIQRWPRPCPQQNNFQPGKIEVCRILWVVFRQSLRNSWPCSAPLPYQGITLWCLSCVCTKSQQHLSQSINREVFLSTQHPPLALLSLSLVWAGNFAISLLDPLILRIFAETPSIWKFLAGFLHPGFLGSHQIID